MAGRGEVKLFRGSGVRRVSVSCIPAKDIRVARDALAEDIVIAEIAIADDDIPSGVDVVKKIARLRRDIASLENIDSFLKEIDHE